MLKIRDLLLDTNIELNFDKLKIVDVTDIYETGEKTVFGTKEDATPMCDLPMRIGGMNVTYLGVKDGELTIEAKHKKRSSEADEDCGGFWQYVPESPVEGFDKEGFISWMEDEFSLDRAENRYAISLIESIVDKGCAEHDHSKDQLAEYLSDLIPEICFMEAAQFCSKDMLTDSTLNQFIREGHPKFMSELEARKRKFEDQCYEAYKLHWMLSHGATLTEAVDGMRDYALESEQPCGSYVASVQQLFKDSAEGFLYCTGFGGQYWACKDEFLDTEFKDEDYMTGTLLDMMPESEKLKAFYREHYTQKEGA